MDPLKIDGAGVLSESVFKAAELCKLYRKEALNNMCKEIVFTVLRLLKIIDIICPP